MNNRYKEVSSSLTSDSSSDSSPDSSSDLSSSSSLASAYSINTSYKVPGSGSNSNENQYCKDVHGWHLQSQCSNCSSISKFKMQMPKLQPSDFHFMNIFHAADLSTELLFLQGIKLVDAQVSILYSTYLFASGSFSYIVHMSNLVTDQNTMPLLHA